MLFSVSDCLFLPFLGVLFVLLSPEKSYEVGFLLVTFCKEKGCL